MEKQELKERLNCRKVSVEIDLLNQHLQKTSNGANVHKRSQTSTTISLCKSLSLERGDLIFEEYKRLYPRGYNLLLDEIIFSIEQYDYQV